MTHTHLPPRAMSALHGGATGKMKLRDRRHCGFSCPCVQDASESPDEPFVRVPAKGRYLLRFHRIEGGIRSVFCDLRSSATKQGLRACIDRGDTESQPIGDHPCAAG